MEISLSKKQTIPMEDFQSRLNDYNTYYKGCLEQLRQRKTNTEEIVIDGFINIYWGLRTAIRLQVADDNVKIRPQTVVGSERLNEPLDKPPDTEAEADASNLNGAMEGLDIQSGIWGRTRQRNLERRSKVKPKSPPPDEGLSRINSVVMRKKKVSRYVAHRGSINGHAFNHKTSVFTPAFGSVTKVRITSRSNANDVITKLMNKFKILNPPTDFSLYVIKETQERRELSADEFPLITRVLVGPNEQLGKLYIIERKRHRDITSEVAQYIKLDINILQVFLKKFNEEEEKEVEQMRKRFELYKKMLQTEMQRTTEETTT
uniref:ras association domain-containing protein 2-like n=1 Tax=Ciona intestinalis TaxID=7719 RepID=UPI00006A35D3|nr:ras association domain-containing protein 2-like [Ciona intestinalis]|eukprot:XP_002121004.1 ras association domain-containing protein 2-like [Ciona intestinalis]